MNKLYWLSLLVCLLSAALKDQWLAFCISFVGGMATIFFDVDLVVRKQQ